MSEISLNTVIVSQMLEMDESKFLERIQSPKIEKKGLATKKNVERLRHCILNDSKRYFGFHADEIEGLDRKHLNRAIEAMLQRRSRGETPQPELLGIGQKRRIRKSI